MIYLMFALAALSGYLISEINPAIILSNTFYKKDIRKCGSGNPGFTNFKRSFGSRLAWLVMVLDLLKSALPCLLFGIIFDKLYYDWELGVAFTCFFSIIGHCFPSRYGFKGGKGFLVCLSAMWIFHPLSGLVATGVMVVLLLITKYMSLSTMLGLVAGVATMPFFGMGDLVPIAIFSLSVLLVIVRHKKNIVRLIGGTETKFYIFGKKDRSASKKNKNDALDKEKKK